MPNEHQPTTSDDLWREILVLRAQLAISIKLTSEAIIERDYWRELCRDKKKDGDGQ